ncbi:alpha/beta fold hydrolase [Aliidiomarina sp. Khilg15.8]
MKAAITLVSFYLVISLPVAQAEWTDESAHDIVFVEMADKTKLEVLDWGGDSKEPLVLLAGSHLNAHTFDEFAEHFTDSFRVIAITRIGHGNSGTPASDFSIDRLATDIVTVLDNFEIENAIFAGHSFAGAELSYLGRHYPERVKGLIYIDAVQEYEHYDQVAANCPDVAQASIDIFKSRESFYETQRVANENGDYLPFVDFAAMDKLQQQNIDRDYTGIEAPAIAINHLPEETGNLLLGVEGGNQACFEAVNKMNYLGIAQFVREKSNADVAAIQQSQHMIHMVTPEKLAQIMKNWMNRLVADSGQTQ